MWPFGVLTIRTSKAPLKQPNRLDPQRTSSAPHTLTSVTILRRPQVESESGYSRSTIYLRITQGLWPRPISLGARAVGWPAGEVAALNVARIAGLTDPQIRELVIRLHGERKNAGIRAASSAG